MLDVCAELLIRLVGRTFADHMSEPTLTSFMAALRDAYSQSDPGGRYDEHARFHRLIDEAELRPPGSDLDDLIEYAFIDFRRMH